MTKRDIFVLLLPSAFFMLVAVLALSDAYALARDRQAEQRHQQHIDQLIRELQSGKLEPSPDKWIAVLRTSEEVQQALVNGHRSLMQVVGGGILAGTGFQVYLVSRLNAARGKAHV